MLVLSRKKNERVHVGEFGIVTVVEVRGEKVRLGFEFDRSIPIHRGEVYDRIHSTTVETQDQKVVVTR